MKKHLLFGLLFAFSIVNAQVTSTNLYQPWKKYGTANTQFTTGVTRTSSLIAIGTLSVGSTATLNTLLLNNSVPVLNLSSSTYAIGRNNYNEGEFFLRYADDFSFIDALNSNSPHVKIKDRMFAINMGTVVPTHTLEVNGNARVSSTFSLGSANLTGGNTGTVAVLSDVIGYINHAYTTGNFSNNQSYIMDDLPTAAKIVLASRNYLPKTITINQYNASIYVLGTPGSGGTTGTLVLQVNGVNTNTVNTALTFTSGVNTFSGTLTQTVAAGSYISTLLMTPNFTTNPTNVMPAVQWWYRQ